MRCPRIPRSTAMRTRTRPARHLPRPGLVRGSARRASTAPARRRARAYRRRADRRRAHDRDHPSRDLRYGDRRMTLGGQRKRVVIGEDDEPIANLLRDAINDEPGYHATVVSHGQKILESIDGVGADLLILDIMMPGLSGFEVYDRLRADAGTTSMPVLFISAAVGHFSEDL